MTQKKEELFNVIIPGYFNSIQPCHTLFFQQLNEEISKKFNLLSNSKIRFHLIILPQHGFDFESIKTLLSSFSFCSTCVEFNDSLNDINNFKRFYSSNYKISVHCIVEFHPNPFEKFTIYSTPNLDIPIYYFYDRHPDFIADSNLFMRRYSPSSFTSETVSDDILREVIESARRSPSAGNLQAYSIMLVKDKETLQKICDAALGQEIITNAAGTFVFITENQQSAAKYGSRGSTMYALQDATIACAHMQLALESFGIQSRWIGAFKDAKIKKVLELKTQDVAALLVFGYGHISNHRSKRRNVNSYITVIE